ncbi:proteinaceous RNase P 1, chloroplastic/mitochondrial-like [Herrania umbratica]|uniref:Proteinaceous RNase P 1, chloroplastic/mitochondrial-like n=1 Tax=Herrania umbratica TaxID=108875 RepID=A0A6J1BEK7_9ROSI|nr:proteinaceous RNase P 1, chloroplastic/mitochondrial-like [Herrania umbratica]
MCLDNIPMNETTLTAEGRMAISISDGHMTFDMVKKMTQSGINPKLRSYSPALSVFYNTGDVDKAFDVEKGMLEHSIHAQEPELEALLKVSTETGKGDNVCYLLHKVKTSVRKMSPSTADIIVKWFESKATSRLGKQTMDQRFIKKAIENGGEGWHRQAWLDKGRWNISYTAIGADALCKCCEEKLALIDLDPKWLDYYRRFETMVDTANVSLFSQRRFMPSKDEVRHSFSHRREALLSFLDLSSKSSSTTASNISSGRPVVIPGFCLPKAL